MTDPTTPPQSDTEGHRAWLCAAWGEPEDLVLGQLPRQPCRAGNVAIRAEAWGVNFADNVLVAGHYQARPAFPFAPGMEVAGTVEETGNGVSEFQVGDRVAAYVEFGGYADRVIAPAPNIARLPDTVSWTEAAAFPVPYATASLALRRADLSPGETILVGGAGGAVGSAGVELAKLAGATVIAVASSDAKAQIARSCGADHVLSSTSDGLRDDVMALVPTGVDVVLDPIGGPFFRSAFRALGYGGRIVSLGLASGDIPSVPVNHILVKHVSVVGSSLGLTCLEDPATVSALWPPLVDRLAKREIRPRVTEVMPFDQLPRALRLLADRALAGRIVLTPGADVRTDAQRPGHAR